MAIWLIEPRDPLIVREGRPFGSDPGASATSLAFPFPSTMAGGARTRSALDENGTFMYDRTDKDQLNKLKKISIRGPLLVQLAEEGDAIAQYQDENAWLVPMPGDVQFFDSDSVDDETGEKKVLLRRLVPLNLPARAEIDFEQQEREKLLHLIGLPAAEVPSGTRKPYSHRLRYWYWRHFQTWLRDPTQLTQVEGITLSSLGHEDLAREYRSHVSIDSDKETGKEGMLFSTSGLEFTSPGAGRQRLKKAQRLALAIDVDEDENAGGRTPEAGVASFGGERRLVTWRHSDAHFPACPDDIREAIKKTGHCRLVLLTPASFALGYYPTWLHTTLAAECGVTVEIKAITVRRPQVVSGWDLALGKPKPSRRLAPAGTVFFLSIDGSADAREKWIEKTWMQCISDDEQDHSDDVDAEQSRRDGFGLAVLGTWSGQPVALEEGQ